ncbi:MAG: chorismate mutase [Chloroflexi bacterium]|jgi:chorismate mutase|nr:MAG: chorismate mutase [Chloroflexota bacterium]
MTLKCRGVRGATTADSNTKEAVVEATQELITAIVEANDIETDDVAAVWFTTTADLTAEFPAVAARLMGWEYVALLCGHEMNVPDAAKLVIRILMLVNTEKGPKELSHVYLKSAQLLRARGVEDGVEE